jgi:hypothetical protein
MNWWDIASLAFFFIAMIYTMVTMGQATSSSDFKNEMAKAITNVTIVNGILIFAMMGMAFVSLGADPNVNTLKTYTIIITHVTLFLAMLSVSISSFQQLSSN